MHFLPFEDVSSSCIFPLLISSFPFSIHKIIPPLFFLQKVYDTILYIQSLFISVSLIHSNYFFRKKKVYDPFLNLDILLKGVQNLRLIEENTSGLFLRYSLSDLHQLEGHTFHVIIDIYSGHLLLLQIQI